MTDGRQPTPGFSTSLTDVTAVDRAFCARALPARRQRTLRIKPGCGQDLSKTKERRPAPRLFVETVTLFFWRPLRFLPRVRSRHGLLIVKAWLQLG
jgi:hypothetical protein